MELLPTDEELHPPRTLNTWQENYLFAALDPQQSCGFYLHIGRQHSLDLSILKAVAFDRSTMVSTCVREPLTDLLEADGLALTVVRPLYEWRVQWRGTCDEAVVGYQCTRPGTSVEVEIDVTMVAALEPILNDYGADGRDETITSGRHYEQGLEMRGTLRIGAVDHSIAGFAIRDHTWGTRRLVDVDYVWWTPMCTFGERPRFVRSTKVVQGSETTSLALVMDAAGVQRYEQVDVDVDNLSGDAPLIGELRLADSTGEESMRFTGVARLPMTYLEGWGKRAILSDETFATVRFADGSEGFGIVEWNRPLPDAERSRLESAIAAADGGGG